MELVALDLDSLKFLVCDLDARFSQIVSASSQRLSRGNRLAVSHTRSRSVALNSRSPIQNGGSQRDAVG